MKRVRGGQSRTVAAGQQKSAGFSLVELLFVVAIVLILAAVAVPMLMTSVAGFRLRGAVASVTGAIQTTRYQAIFNGYPFQVVFDSTTLTYQVKSDKNRAGVYANFCVDTTLASCPIPLTGSMMAATINQSTTLTFSPGGSVTSPQAVGGVTQIILTYKSKQETINVSSYGNTKVTIP